MCSSDLWGKTSQSACSFHASVRCAATVACFTYARSEEAQKPFCFRTSCHLGHGDDGDCVCVCVCVWQVCAANFGDIGSVVGGEATEDLLVS